MPHRLSKSRFQTGLQCPRALWLGVHRPELKDPLTEMQEHVFASGTSLGELARERFSEGVLVAEDYTQGEQALAATERLMADPPPAIFEAAFKHEGVFVRPDVLVRLADGRWDLYEVKSSTRLKAENLTDVAVQLWVLEGAGLRIRRAHLMHIDNTYVYQGGQHDLQRLFVAEDVTEEARGWVPEVPRRIAEMIELLDGPEPEVPIGRHCEKPYPCSYRGTCHAFLPEMPVTLLPRISTGMLGSLLADGIHAIADIPPLYPGLTTHQRTVCETVRSGECRFVGDLSRALADLAYPLHFLDFETMMPALPLYPGTRPYQQLPFQWSDHVLAADGTLEHVGFLHDGVGDPRPAFIERLLAQLGERGTVVVYSPFESTRLGELAKAFPEHASAIEAVRARLFDLERVVGSHVRHPATAGHTSIKLVLPALVPDLSYKDLGIGEGGTASLRYLQVATGALAPEAARKVLDDLEQYCALDTLAMVEIYRVLEREAAAGAA